MVYNSDRSFGLICFAEDTPVQPKPPADTAGHSDWATVKEMIIRNYPKLPDEVARAFIDQVVNPDWSAGPPPVGSMAVRNEFLDNTNQ